MAERRRLDKPRPNGNAWPQRKTEMLTATKSLGSKISSAFEFRVRLGEGVRRKFQVFA